MSWPGHIPAGSRCGHLMNGIDVTATLLDLMGAPPLPESSGRSVVLELLNPRSTNWQERAFSDYSSRMFGPDGGCYQRMIREGEFELVYHAGLISQLVNLAEDPEELHDLGQEPKFDNIRRELEEIVLNDWDPSGVAVALERAESPNSIFEKWGRNTNLKDTIHWHLDPSMNWLERDND